MARDGSGTYSLPATMATAGAQSSAATVNSIMNDIAQALTDSVNKDGTKAFAAAQSMGGNRLTNVGTATALTDAATLSQVQSGAVQRATTVGGTVDAITLSFTPAMTAYANGTIIRWRSGGANTVAGVTINCNSIGAKTLKKNNGEAALVAADLGPAGTEHFAIYNGTYFVLLNPAIYRAVGTDVLTGTNTSDVVTPDALAALWEEGENIASAGTITVGEGGFFDVTGTTTITDIDPSTDKAGRKFILRFANVLTLTHHATTLILPGGANITTAAGDCAHFVSEGSDAVRCVAYMRASGAPVYNNAAVLLGSITTTSGSSASLSSLDLTSYAAIELHLYGVSHNNASPTTLLVGNSTSDDVAFTESIAGSIALTGRVFIQLVNGIGVSNIGDNGGAPLVTSFDSAIGTASTAISVAPTAGNFDAGIIRVWGYKG